MQPVKSANYRMLNVNELKRKYRTPTLLTLFPQTSIPTNKKHKMQRKLHILKTNEKEFNRNLIHNFSDYELTADEHKILCKGLTYSLNTTTYRKADKKQDLINQLQTKINKQIYFHDKNRNQQNPTTATKHPFKNSTNWNPDINDNETLNELYESLMNTQIETNNRPTTIVNYLVV